MVDIVYLESRSRSWVSRKSVGLTSERSPVRSRVGLLGAVVVLSLGKAFTHTCYSGKSPACEPPTDLGDVFVQSLIGCSGWKGL